MAFCHTANKLRKHILHDSWMVFPTAAAGDSKAYYVAWRHTAGSTEKSWSGDLDFLCHDSWRPSWKLAPRSMLHSVSTWIFESEPSDYDMKGVPRSNDGDPKPEDSIGLQDWGVRQSSKMLRLFFAITQQSAGLASHCQPWMWEPD